MTSPTAVPKASPTVDITAVHAQFKAKDSQIADLKQQITDLQNENAHLKSEVGQLKSATGGSSGNGASTTTGLPTNRPRLREYKDVEIHATFVKQGQFGDSVAFTGTIENVGNRTLSKVDVYCHLHGFYIVGTDTHDDPDVYRDIYGDTYRNLRPGESRQLSIVISMDTSSSGYGNVPANDDFNSIKVLRGGWDDTGLIAVLSGGG